MNYSITKWASLEAFFNSNTDLTDKPSSPKATVEMSVLFEKQIIALENNHIMIVNKKIKGNFMYFCNQFF
ncbi:MAG: hypothetical protein LBV02_04400 [Bacteroidales bacterium]|jgi:hypothetical protein|nr:hypothetical protein [Bacteroidales bacterium]